MKGFADCPTSTPKVFQGRWTKGIRPGDVSNELGVTEDEMGKTLFGLTAVPDGEEEVVGDHHAKGPLSLVH